MITILRNLWSSREARRNELVEKLEEEQRNLDNEIDKENTNANAQPSSCMKNVIQTNNPNEGETHVENSDCFKRTGKFLTRNHCVFDIDILYIFLNCRYHYEIKK